MATMQIQHFYDPRTSTLTYVVFDEASRAAVVIDPVLDFDAKSGRVFHDSVERVAAFVDEQGLELVYALDTHPHADHMTALPWFRQRHGAKTGVSAEIRVVQETWRERFNLGADFPVDGSQFDVLLEDGETLSAGPLKIEALLTEGHTPASMTFKIGDALFVGDLLFMPDAGTARCDFPGGSAAVMYDAVMRLYALPDEARVFTLHDYQPGGRELRFESTIGEERRENVHIREGVTKEEFVALRANLEQGKEFPTLLFPSVQVNIDGGRLPRPESNGMSYLKLPIDLSRLES
jgi:glyoxylase-like metal-dependent hydrolase (beta-lactamase superfamily II)